MIIASRINFYIYVFRLNDLITLVLSYNQNGKEIIRISRKNTALDLLCFINLAKGEMIA